MIATPRPGTPKRLLLAGLTVVFLSASGTLVAREALCQSALPRILKQDSTLNNFVDPAGYKPGPPDALGHVERTGTGAQAMILIPGLGFGGDVFKEFMADHAGEYRMYAVTLAGFGGTPAPPSPDTNVSFGSQTWTNGQLAAIERLIVEEGIKRPIVVGHWLTGTQLALRLAMKHPDHVRAVIILSGSARFASMDTTRTPAEMPLAKRVAGVDRFMAPRWFKTVTRETWDDNNFLPSDYAVHPLRGLRLWREAASPDLHTWIRYLCEYHAQDITLDLGSLKVPTLILEPGLEGLVFDPGNNYMDAFCGRSWEGPNKLNSAIRYETIPNTRACMWFDQPEKVNAVIAEFLGEVN